jgi:hypothetical protein
MRTKIILACLIILSLIIVLFVRCSLQDDETKATFKAPSINILDSQDDRDKKTIQKGKTVKSDNPEDKDWFDLPDVIQVMQSLEQFDIIRIYTHSEPLAAMNTGVSESFKRQASQATSIIGGSILTLDAKYYIVLSNTQIIRSKDYPNVVIAPVLDIVNRTKANDQGSFIQINMKGEDAYIMTHNLRSVPKLAVVNFYSKISPAEIEKVKIDCKNEFGF